MSHRRPLFSRPVPRHFFAAMLVLATASLSASTAFGQVWNENGDAGDLVSTAQTTLGTGTLTQINGTLSSPGDVDVYCIQAGPSVVLPFVPLLSLQCTINQGPNVYVFDANGLGGATNETCQAGGKSITNTYLPVFSPGTFYVAVAHYGNEPTTGTGTIWQLGLPGERVPDGTDPANPLAGWSGLALPQPSTPYTINFPNSGVVVQFCDAAVSTEAPRWGAVKARYE